MAQNFIPKTSTILYSITKGISKTYKLEREWWVFEVLQKHQRSIIYSFIFVHSLASENDKNVALIVCDFHTEWGKSYTLQKIQNILRLFSYYSQQSLRRTPSGPKLVSVQHRVSLEFWKKIKIWFRLENIHRVIHSGVLNETWF